MIGNWALRSSSREHFTQGLDLMSEYEASISLIEFLARLAEETLTSDLQEDYPNRSFPHALEFPLESLCAVLNCLCCQCCNFHGRRGRFSVGSESASGLVGVD